MPFKKIFIRNMLIPEMNMPYPVARGILSESRVEEALNELTQQRKPKYGLKHRIVRFFHSDKNGPLDKWGVDFQIELDNGAQVPLQVKSGTAGARNFARHCRRLGKFIPVIIVHLNESLRSLMRKIANAIKAGLLAKVRYINRHLHMNRMPSSLYKAVVRMKKEAAESEPPQQFVKIQKFRLLRQPCFACR